jgi:ribonuclease D
VRELALLVDTRPSVLRHEQDWVLDLIKRSHTVTQADYPPPITPSMPRAWSSAFKHVKQCLRQLADSHHIPPEFLSRKQHLEDFFWSWIMHHELVVPGSWQGWRWQLFGESVQNALPSKDEAGKLKEAL